MSGAAEKGPRTDTILPPPGVSGACCCESAPDLRACLARLEERGEVVHVQREVDPRFELSALSKALAPEGAVVFEQVRGSSAAVVVGTDGTRERIARSIGTDGGGLLDRYRAALEQPVPPTVVLAAPVQEEVREGDEVDLFKQLPQIVHYEGDVGAGITSGMVLSRSPDGAIRNLSFHRMQVVGPREIRIAVFPRHLAALLARYEAEGLAMPIVGILGCETAMRLAAATWGGQLPLGYDELGLAGGLRGAAVELAPAVSIAGQVPARAEIVIEGEILPGVRAMEGPFAECTGHYSRQKDRPVMRVTALTHRAEPLYQDLLVGSEEHLLLQGLPQELMLHSALGAIFPGLRGVHVTNGGCGKFHAVVSLCKQRGGDGKEAILATYAAARDLKMVVVVDDDVDPFDADEVEWAIATRFQADRDLVVVAGACGNEIDPSASEGFTAKMGIDATKGAARTASPRINIPGFDDVDLQRGIVRPARPPGPGV